MEDPDLKLTDQVPRALVARLDPDGWDWEAWIEAGERATDRLVEELVTWEEAAFWDAFLRALETPPGWG
ncbi:hypothetical protein GQ464_002340 [Rhodocaloribacter litoris]|uniref:hypothetical protein n=1 Tax=Rhodocaloribacter litoris TaxID=2558931 RepID=UPI00141FE2C0|nr:hypothetical protein [Rhodocaloribacter litoris]QXD15807.1 hypothetical protein GQ464_002340 [Rhodocaloribacter litoris]